MGSLGEAFDPLRCGAWPKQPEINSLPSRSRPTFRSRQERGPKIGWRRRVYPAFIPIRRTGSYCSKVRTPLRPGADTTVDRPKDAILVMPAPKCVDGQMLSAQRGRPGREIVVVTLGWRLPDRPLAAWLRVHPFPDHQGRHQCENQRRAHRHVPACPKRRGHAPWPVPR
jgi:hypothetical protein